MNNTLTELPNLDCGICGYPTCNEFAAQLNGNPDLIKRCIHLEGKTKVIDLTVIQKQNSGCSGSCSAGQPDCAPSGLWADSLSREFDFYLDQFPEDSGPREVILPRNPMMTRELNIQPGEYLVGRPLGMSCGCPVTHCGVVVKVDHRTGVIVWCITGPLGPRNNDFKDIGYYSAEAYEGMVKQSRAEIKIGGRYFFMPHRCMLQWRHSGLVNYLNRTPEGQQIRIEGLWIG